MNVLRSVGPWLWAGLLTASAIFIVLLLGSGQDLWTALQVVFIVALFGALGALVEKSQPGNRVSWLLYLVGFGILLTSTLNEVLVQPVEPSFLDYFLIWLGNSTGAAVVFYPISLLLFVFPDGKFLSKRWSWGGWLGAVLVPAIAVLGAFTVEIGPNFGDPPWSLDNPIGFVPNALYDFVLMVWSISVVVLIPIGGVVALITRYRRSSSVVRTQIKWILYAAGVAAVALPLGLWVFSGVDPWSGFFTSIAIMVVPIAITIAVTRYRLFEIDRIISRTVTYGLIVVLLGLVFAAGAVWVPTTLGLEESPLLVAASTLAVAALFNPLRKRVQRSVDRRFNRSSYRAEQVTDELADTLRDTHTAGELAEIWITTIDQHFEPASSGIWLKETVE